MDTVEYAGTFVDSRGTERIRISNDGSVLRTEIRGVRFAGSDFDGLSPEAEQLVQASELFSLQLDCLCACELRFAIPVLVSVDG
jgi:hypothetical protein